MDSRVNYLHRISFLLVALLLFNVVVGCGDESDQILGPVTEEHSEFLPGFGLLTMLWTVCGFMTPRPDC